MQPIEKIQNPASIAIILPSNRPSPVEATDGQMVITVTSLNSGGAAQRSSTINYRKPSVWA